MCYHCLISIAIYIDVKFTIKFNVLECVRSQNKQWTTWHGQCQALLSQDWYKTPLAVSLRDNQPYILLELPVVPNLNVVAAVVFVAVDFEVKWILVDAQRRRFKFWIKIWKNNQLKHTNFGFRRMDGGTYHLQNSYTYNYFYRNWPIRPNPNGRINKNRTAEKNNQTAELNGRIWRDGRI